MSKDLGIATKQRLESYGVFHSSVVDEVARFSAYQDTFITYQDFFKAVGIPQVKTHFTADGDGVPLVDIPARTVAKGTLIVHASMTTALDPNQLYQLATIAGVNPEYRIIAFGNPSGDQYYDKAQELTFLKRFKIMFTNNKRSLVAAELEYLNQQGITDCYQIGYSYGALKATIESGYMTEGGLRGLLLVDPVAKPRTILRLLSDFKKTYGPLGKYVNQVNLKTYHAARGDAARNRNFNRALLRPINLTIAWLLSRTSIIASVQSIAQRHPRAQIGIAWGTESELSDDEWFRCKIAKINEANASRPVHTMRFEGLEHAFANDIHLYAAIVRQFLLR